ncbi:MAG: hypothetical protein MJ142_02850 [Clostridia bacterium]|nr:hypothetical protein [Clostridia bacterium]
MNCDLLFLILALVAVLSFCTVAEADTVRSPEELPKRDGMPPLMTLENGMPVRTAEDWALRRAELLDLYSVWMYGKMPDPSAETVTWEIAPHEKLPGQKLTIHIARDEKETSFSVVVNLPEEPAPEGGRPCYLEYGFSWGGGVFISDNCKYAASRGYAGITYIPTDVASDNERHTGAFYRLYPFDGEAGDFPGVLAAWAWGASKVIDALENGAGEALGIDPRGCIVAGVSRYGKSAAVAGAYDSRIRVTVPSCSGAGGVAVYRTDNHGKEYDLSSLGGSESWVNDSINEPLSNLQGGEGYWFCENFRKIPDAESIPVEQYMLCALAAAPDRHLIVVTGITSEGWNNTEGQCLAWLGSQPVWELLGCGEQKNMIIHPDGHAILNSDMKMILDYCDVHLRGADPAEAETDFSLMKGNLFLQYNRDRLDPAFDLPGFECPLFK